MMSKPPEFLYPRAREHAFDEVCEHIVRALEKRHFDVPGINVEFDVYGSGEQRMRMVRRITGQNFSLYFSRSQGLLPEGTYNDTAAVNTVAIEGEQISVYEDHSGPSYYVYVGDDWERDREWFFRSSCLVNSKLYGESRRYLKYSGSDETSRQVRFGYHRYGNKYAETAKFLLHTNDMHREYEPGPHDKPFYVTHEVTERMAAQLKIELKQIEETQERNEPFQFDEPVPVPVEGCPEFWTFAEHRAAERIKTGQTDIDELRLSDRYALNIGYRLLPYGCPADGLGHDPEKLHDGYVWCALNPEQIPYEAKSLSMGNALVRVRPTRFNDIYVVDEAAYEQTRAELSARIDKENEDRPEDDKRTRFTDDEVNEQKRARAKTFVPWLEYDGSFEKPVVLIGREIGLDEVQIVKTAD